MCGIFVAVSADGLGGLNMRNAIYEAMVTGWVRGAESTGIFTVNRLSNAVLAHKSIFRGAEYMDTNVPRRMMNDLDTFSVFVGHHRWCTSGVVSQPNAHPHVQDHITLVHNGGIHNDNWLPHTGVGIPSTDSARVTYNLAKLGDLALEEFLGKLTGSYVFVWWDAKEESLKIVRNDQRPLFFTWAKGQKQIFFASEKLHLQWILERNDIELQPNSDKEDKDTMYQLLPLTVHTIKIVKNRVEITHKSFTTSDPYKYKQAVREATVGNWPHWDRQRAAEGEQSVLFLPGQIETEPLDPENKQFPVIPPLKLPQISKKRIKVLNDKLERVGTEFGRVHIAQPLVFENSAHGQPGVHGTGYFGGVAEKEIDFIVPNLSQTQYNAIVSHGTVAHVQVTGLLKGNQGDKPLIICHIDWVKTRNHWIRRQNLEARDKGFSVSGEDGHLDDLIMGPGATLITLPHYMRLVKDGCANCAETILEKDAISLNWVKDDRPICDKCWLSSEFWQDQQIIEGYFGD